MSHRFSQELPNAGTRLELITIGRTVVNALRTTDFALLGDASPIELKIALESAQQEPPNLPMVSFLAGVATTNRAVAHEAGDEVAASAFMGIMTGVMTTQFGYEIHV